MRRSPFAAGSLLACAALAGAGGCEPAAEPDFPEPVGYAGLLEEIRVGTRGEVEDYETGEVSEQDLEGFDEALRVRFGTPSDPAVFTALPVRFGRGEAVVAEAIDDAEAGTTTFRLSPAESGGELPAAAVGDPLHWNDDRGDPHAATISAVDADAGTVTVPLVPPEHLPARVPMAFDEETGEPLPGPVLIGEPDLLHEGRALYVTHCAHCHGSAGSGDGPTANYLFPLPRNYQPGVYKFTSTGSGTPRREDLTRILHEGIPGTYMPAFHPALTAEQTAAVVEYVRWLSMRGQYAKGLVDEVAYTYGEQAVNDRLANEEGLTRADVVQELIAYWADDVTGKLGFVGTLIGEAWALADADPPVTPAEPRPALPGEELAASVERGRALYLQANTQCVSCHGPRGLGNGPQTVSVQLDAATGERYAEPGLHDVWGNVVLPRNLTRGVYRGGRRPVDLYRRIHSGIAASNMPGFGDNLSDAQIWDLVNFLLALPYDPGLLDGAVAEDPHAVAAN